MGQIHWKRTSGSVIATNDVPETVKWCQAQGWEQVQVEVAVKEIKHAEKDDDAEHPDKDAEDEAVSEDGGNEEGDSEGEDDLTPEKINAMRKNELLELAEEWDISSRVQDMSVLATRKELVAYLFADEED